MRTAISTIIFITLLFSLGAGYLLQTGGELQPEVELPAYSTKIRANDPWVVTGTEYINDTQELWARDIRVEAGGMLVFDNARINFDTMTEPVFINVTAGGIMRVLNSTVFDLNNFTNPHGYFIWSYGELEILNSTINFAGYTAITNGSGCSDPQPCTDYFGAGIRVVDGTAKISGTTICNSTYAVLKEGGLLKVENSRFENNFYGIYGYYTSGIQVKNTVLTQNYYAFFLISTKAVEISDCTLELNLFGMFVEDSDIVAVSSTFRMNTETAISGYRGTELTLIDCIISYMRGAFLGYNLFLETSTLVMQNSTSENGLWGIYLMNCTAEISQSKLIENQLTGVYVYYSVLELSNSTISGNDNGVLLENSAGNLTGNDIVENNIGVFAYESAPVVDYNIIAANTYFGVQSLDMEFSLGTGNEFTDGKGSENGWGRFQQIYTVYVKVTDTYNNVLPFADYSVTNRSGEEIYNGTLNVKATVDGAKLWLHHYWVDNEGSRVEPGPHKITIWWGNTSWGGFIYDSVSISVSPDSNKYIKLERPIPDIYVTDDDIKISATSVEEGD
ncbi:MAG: right-handed parallel beta-helix repeat-containing protein, partial [Thermoplasmata archaeon]